MVVLKLYSHHLQAIRAHGEQTYPEECCGLLLGQMQEDEKILKEVIPVQNSWNDDSANAFQVLKEGAQREASKRRRFAIAPEVMLQAQKDARDRSLDIIGIYHSHPDYPAVPSEFDRAIAWQAYSYIIVSVQRGNACDLKSWSLDDRHQFQPEAILTAVG